ncbi:hypothetical protein OG874_35585 [Nocardia sp. NBC_00565]|uniref:hypothetical protein n=1 Tax=Nocardia sp. NBC_00565 TaxID=2975993 RepID=UPI002E819A0F|nr:hypothetical protein [Nocardia sp. NBC_00565]WUC02013.1 hypothetical protein OG874_35585 [Nocardia sp. NBC_00565]
MTFEVRVERRDGRWALNCDDVGSDVLATVVRLADAESVARDRLAIVTDMAASAIEVEIVVQDVGPTPNLQQRSAALLEKRALEASLKKQIADETDALVRELDSEGIPARDIATLTGVNHQRVSQLVNRK